MQLAVESCMHDNYRIIYSADQLNNFIKLDIENCLVYHANYNYDDYFLNLIKIKKTNIFTSV